MRAAYCSVADELAVGKDNLARWARCADTGARRRRWRECPASAPPAAAPAAAPVAGPPVLKQGQNHRVVGICGCCCATAGGQSAPRAPGSPSSPEERSRCTSGDKPRHRYRRMQSPAPVRPGMRYTTMDTEAAPMMTTSSALVMRLSVCRKRIMDGLEPSTLYARAGGAFQTSAGQYVALLHGGDICHRCAILALTRFMPL